MVLVVKNPPASAGDPGDAGLIPGSGRSPGGGCGNPRQHSCLENPVDRGAWQATVHGGHKESDMTEVTSHTTFIKFLLYPSRYSFRDQSESESEKSLSCV